MPLIPGLLLAFPIYTADRPITLIQRALYVVVARQDTTAGSANLRHHRNKFSGGFVRLLLSFIHSSRSYYESQVLRLLLAAQVGMLRMHSGDDSPMIKLMIATIK